LTRSARGATDIADMAMRQDVAKRVGTSRKYSQLTAENPDQSCFVGARSNASLVLKKRLSSFQ
jgi:hypothetical protein